MENGKTVRKNRLAGILGMGYITLPILAVFLAWGHLQGRSHEVISLYLTSCKGLEQGVASIMTSCIALF